MLAVASVGLRRFLRERSNIFFALILPFLIIFLVGFGAGSETTSVVGVVGADGTPLGSTSIDSTFLDSTFLDNGAVETREYTNEDEAVRAVENTEISAVIIFDDDPSAPIRFAARPGVGLDARVALDDAVAAENLRIAVDRQAQSVGAEEGDIEQARMAVTAVPVETELVGSELWEGLTTFEASSLTQVILFMFLSALTAASFLVQDRELGMARRKASTPISSTRLVAGETLGRFWIVMFQALLITGVTGIVFGVDWGDPLATGAILVTFALVATGAGVFLGTALDTSASANGIGIMAGLVLAALGGAMAPVEIFPPAMQTAARLTPHYWAIEGLKISLSGGSLADVSRPVAVLAAGAVVILGIAVPLYRRKIYRGR